MKWQAELLYWKQYFCIPFFFLAYTIMIRLFWFSILSIFLSSRIGILKKLRIRVFIIIIITKKHAICPILLCVIVYLRKIRNWGKKLFITQIKIGCIYLYCNLDEYFVINLFLWFNRIRRTKELLQMWVN